MASATWTQSRSKNCWDFTDPGVTYVDNGNGTAKVTIQIYARRIDSTSPFYGRTTTVSSNSLTQNSFTAYNLDHGIYTQNEWSKNNAIENVATLVVTGTPNSSGVISCTIKIYGVATSYGYGTRDCTMTISALNGITVTNKYTISYNSNGGSGSMTSQSVTAGSAATLKSNGFTAPTSRVWTLTLNGNGGNNGSPTFKSNYFNKWRAGSTTGTAYAAGASYTPTANTTMYAWWGTNYVWGTTTRSNTTANGYKVTFNANGGSCSTTSLTAIDTTSYTFLGWASSSTATTAGFNSTSEYGQTSNYTAYAVWSPTTTKGSITMPSATRSSSSSMTITLNYDGATGNNSMGSVSSTKTITYPFNGWSADSSATSGSAAGTSFTPTASGTVYAIWGSSSNTYSAVTLPIPTKTNYTFGGWATSAGGTVVSTGGSYTPTSDITNLYAIWTLNTFNVVLTAKTGIDSVSGGGSKTVGDSVTINATLKTGYRWTGWFNSGTTTMVSDAQSYTFIMPANDVSYDAFGHKNTYKVAYEANGGSGTMTTSTFYYDTDETLRINTYTRLGYAFQGWATSLENAEAGTVTYTDGATVNSLTSVQDGIITLYAVWKPVTNMYIYTKDSSGNMNWVPALKYVYTTTTTTSTRLYDDYSGQEYEGSITYIVGQTWADWCNSTYNTPGLYCSNGYVYGPNGTQLYELTTTNTVLSTDIINSNGYEFI